MTKLIRTFYSTKARGNTVMICEHLDPESKFLKNNLYYWLPDGTELGYLCEECAIEAGVCPYCGQYENTPQLRELGACHECVEANTEYGDES